MFCICIFVFYVLVTFVLDIELLIDDVFRPFVFTVNPPEDLTLHLLVIITCDITVCRFVIGDLTTCLQYIVSTRNVWLNFGSFGAC